MSRSLPAILPVAVAMLLHPGGALAEPSSNLPPTSISAIPDPPIPEPRPDRREEASELSGAGASPMPVSERRCRRALIRAGARFTEEPPIDDPSNGCRIAHPVLVEELGGGVALEPPALLTCPMAAAMAEFLHDVVVPSAERHFGAAPVKVVQMSAYVCRTRHGSDTVSEHALGNALDWGAVSLEDGETIEVRDHGPDEAPRQDFLDEVREAACGPFATVLGPGTDADHADHFHFDLAERGAAYCR